MCFGHLILPWEPRHIALAGRPEDSGPAFSGDAFGRPCDNLGDGSDITRVFWVYGMVAMYQRCLFAEQSVLVLTRLGAGGSFVPPCSLTNSFFHFSFSLKIRTVRLKMLAPMLDSWLLGATEFVTISDVVSKKQPLVQMLPDSDSLAGYAAGRSANDSACVHQGMVPAHPSRGLTLAMQFIIRRSYGVTYDLEDKKSL